MVNSFFKIELKRAFFRWKTFIAFIIFMAVFIHISYLDKLDIPNTPTYLKYFFLENHNGFISYLKAMGFVNSYMAIVFPIIILLVVGDSLIEDVKTGFLQFYLTRTDWKNYIRSKTIAVSLVSFMVTFIFQVCAFIYSMITHPFYIPRNIDAAPSYARGLYMLNPYLYILLICIIFSLISIVIALFAIALSNRLKNSSQAILIPWILYLILGIGLNCIDSIYSFSPVFMCGPFIFERFYSGWEIILYWSVILFLSIYLGFKLFSKNFVFNK
ncbi:ABC transporter permease [Clostridium botulinum]|uniref:Membrane protein n=2 Tax=Clostridium botulinum TaxID=1491 RepID=A5HXR9_CLOBH|nr:ABC transporter permease [Clostridium botulinum]EKX80498.1 hypothetical protein CFSAN001628_006129 [Clostridium botulinum CFSAN001628]EPS50363.1 hypothetical protein CFSAN002369_07840 [Clostridium botulinum CFSAN002369]ABS32968.1 putative membrane protein [Clostridium botulinum A str. ATCC 19397]ABS36159.1 putative membrane protein [Clostridium botulinum A str. Hall]ACA44966.1 putative membrane protein [Clostridium botulinum B1 str. Okra]